MAERGRFELPIDLRLCRISSAVHSTTLPPLRETLRLGRSGGCLAWDSAFHKRQVRISRLTENPYFLYGRPTCPKQDRLFMAESPRGFRRAHPEKLQKVV